MMVQTTKLSRSLGGKFREILQSKRQGGTKFEKIRYKYISISTEDQASHKISRKRIIKRREILFPKT